MCIHICCGLRERGGSRVHRIACTHAHVRDVLENGLSVCLREKHEPWTVIDTAVGRTTTTATTITTTATSFSLPSSRSRVAGSLHGTQSVLRKGTGKRKPKALHPYERVYMDPVTPTASVSHPVSRVSSSPSPSPSSPSSPSSSSTAGLEEGVSTPRVVRYRLHPRSTRTPELPRRHSDAYRRYTYRELTSPTSSVVFRADGGLQFCRVNLLGMSAIGAR